MKISTRLLFAILMAFATSLQAGPRVSELGDYTITTDTLDAGGTRTTHAGASYTNVSSLGGISSVSTGSTATAMAGYHGQLYDVVGFTITANASGMNETGSLQLEPFHLLDDATQLAIAPASVTWSVESGPINVTTDGVALGEIVYQNTPAAARGTLGAFSALFDLTVYDVAPDNYGSYAADGLVDSWQFQYFGLDDPDAAPNLDADGDGQDNKFEFTAGLNPTDPMSRFLLRIEPVPGQAAKKNLIFSPIVAGRTYTIEHSSSLAAGSWAALTGTTQGDEAGVRTVTDHAATELKIFYHVIVEKP